MGVGDTLLKACQISNHCVKGEITKVFAKLGQIAVLVRSSGLKTGNEITEQMQACILTFLNVVNGFGDLCHTLSTPVCGLQWYQAVIGRNQRCKADKRQAWRTIADDKVVPVANRFQRIVECALLVAGLPNFDVDRLSF